MANKFDFHYWIDKFKGEYRPRSVYNDAPEVRISYYDCDWKIVGVHRLTPNERPDYPSILVDIYCAQNARDNQHFVRYAWTGMRPQETPQPVFVRKGPDELQPIPNIDGVTMSVWGDDGDLATGFADGESYFVFFMDMSGVTEEPTPNPVPDPTPDPEPPEPKPPTPPDEPAIVGVVSITLKKDFLMGLEQDEHGNVTFQVELTIQF